MSFDAWKERPALESGSRRPSESYGADPCGVGEDFPGHMPERAWPLSSPQCPARLRIVHVKVSATASSSRRVGARIHQSSRRINCRPGPRPAILVAASSADRVFDADRDLV